MASSSTNFNMVAEPSVADNILQAIQSAVSVAVTMLDQKIEDTVNSATTKIAEDRERLTRTISDVLHKSEISNTSKIDEILTQVSNLEKSITDAANKEMIA